MSRPLPRPYLHKFIGSVVDCLDAFTAALFIFEPDKKRLKLEAFHSLSDAIVPEAVIEEGKGFLSWVMKHQRPVHVPRFNRDSVSLGFYNKDVGLKSFLAVPLPDEAGVLCVDSRSRYAFSVKHERILHALAETACQLLKAERNRGLLDFYARVMKWQMASYETHEEALVDLLNALDFEVAIVARHLVDTSFIVVEDILKGEGRAGQSLIGEKIPLSQGIAGWIAKHESSILLERRRRDSERGYLLRSGEPFKSGPVVAAIFCPNEGEGLGMNYCFVFSGSADVSKWPTDFLQVMEFLLKGLLPWH